MTIPTTRDELISQLDSSYRKLSKVLDQGGVGSAGLICVDDWRIKDLLAVRLWWTQNVVHWVEAGRQGQHFELPAAGYQWKETPRLNAKIVSDAGARSYEEIRSDLNLGFECVKLLIKALDDIELLEVGTFEWAGKWPVSRWISINTIRQYSTASSLVRRAISHTT